MVILIENKFQGLRCSPNHWPCIDNIITVLYALGDYVGCLYFISKGLQMDVGFTKGHIFKDRIFKNSPSLVKDFPLFYPDW
jgi:calcineurin-binding protein cabin-1